MNRRRWMPQVNPKRKAQRRAEAFGEQAELCASLRCCVCGHFGAIPHHTVSRPHGKDADTVPLCPNHHTDGPEAVHRMGRKSFEARHGVDLREIAAGLARRIEQAHESA